MIAEAENLLTGHTKQGTRPMIRLRVEYTDRFGNMFKESVSNGGRFLISRGRLLKEK